MSLSEQMGEFNFDSFDIILKATLLLILSVSGNFLSETLGCKSRKILDNLISKQILLFFMIYFTINFTQTHTIVNPIINVFKAFMVWVMYLFFTHMSMVPTVIVCILLIILFFISNYRAYIKKNNHINEDKLDYVLKKIQRFLWVVLILILLIGCGSYYFGKKKEYGSKFSSGKFIFGVKKCSNTTKSPFF
jgi:hypothetical protein